MALSGGVAQLVNDTIVRNRAAPTRGFYGGLGGGLFASGNTTVGVTNVILRGNRAGGNRASTGGNGGDLWVDGGSVVNADHDDIGDRVSLGTFNDLGGNVSVNPQLVHSFELSSTSPVIDAGTCSGAPPRDIEGDPRPSGAGCDIGADEFQF